MPKTGKQRIVFGILMSFVMAYGMEIYNVSIQMGYNLTERLGYSSITYAVFAAAAKETLFMGVIVFAASNLIGNRAGIMVMNRYCDTEKDNPYFCRIMRQAGTIAVMCPLMSLIASLIFQIAAGGRPIAQLPVIWIGTVLKNFPMAFFWNMFAAAPLVHWIFETWNRRQERR